VAAASGALGLIADFGSAAVSPTGFADLVEGAIRRNPGLRRAQILHDPQRYGISSEQYVRDFLRPAYERVRERAPGIRVVAAAPSGDRKSVPTRFQRLTDAGADEVSDDRGVNVYFDDSGALASIAAATRRPIIVTETGTSDPSQHVRWYTEVIPRIRSGLGADAVCWYVLLESPDLAGGPVSYDRLGFSLIAPTADAAGRARGADGSQLYSVLTGSALTEAR
jgi:hypothetical protein